MKTKIKLKLRVKSVLARTAVLFLVLFSITINSSAVLAADLYYKDSRITPTKMIDLTNRSREEKGLPILTVNQKLTDAAEAKAGDMFKFQYFDHNSPSGVTPWDWIKASGYNYHYAGENLAIDFITAESAHKALMASDSHRENILNQNYTEIGVAVKKGIFEKSESIIIVMEFGSPFEKKVAYAGENDSSGNIGLVESIKLDNNVATSNAGEKPQKEKELTEPQPIATSSDLKNDYQDNEKNRKEQKNKEKTYLNNRDCEDGKKNAYNPEIIQFVGISADSIKKIKLEKVYLENIYWESYSKRNGNSQTTVMLSSRQNKSVFNSDVFYVCVLSILSAFELSYVFSSFMIDRKFRTENVQSDWF